MHQLVGCRQQAKQSSEQGRRLACGQPLQGIAGMAGVTCRKADSSNRRHSHLTGQGALQQQRQHKQHLW